MYGIKFLIQTQVDFFLGKTSDLKLFFAQNL